VKPETIKLVRMHAALSGDAVTVARCPACGGEVVVSPRVEAENGPPRRCPECAHRELDCVRYRVDGDAIVEFTA
jgi:DNA-directed RNA polymerase subunit RPC12/RpoP